MAASGVAKKQTLKGERKEDAQGHGQPRGPGPNGPGRQRHRRVVLHRHGQNFQPPVVYPVVLAQLAKMIRETG